MIETRCPAKINLFLRVVGVLPDGYHELETLFQEIDLSDTLSWDPHGGALALEVMGADVGPIESNLVWRAIGAFAKASGKNVEGSFRLDKRIPSGAGLGGGSSDAAATLRLLNDTLGQPLNEDELARIALTLGSDVPFFLRGGCQLARGRGEQLCAATPPAGPSAGYLMFPGISLSTSSVFRTYAAGARLAQAARPLIGENDLLNAALELSSDFARFWASLSFELREDTFFMTGSGSSCVWLTECESLPGHIEEALKRFGARALAFRYAIPERTPF